MLQAKTYWSILKSFYNDRKVPLTPPLLIDDKFVTGIQTKANIFNKFFADQCQPLNNPSDLPRNQIFSIQSRLCMVFGFQRKRTFSNNKNTHGLFVGLWP